jgi:hypothetical protein
LNISMTQPKGDLADLSSGLQDDHRRGVSKNVGCELFFSRMVNSA